MAQVVSRRRDVWPVTWEIPALIMSGSVLGMVLGVHVGRGLAVWTAGGRWVWPAPAKLFTAVVPVLDGDTLAGLPGPLLVTVERAALLGWIAAVEVMFLLAAGAGSYWVLGRWGPGRVRGVASGEEAERLLGRSRLFRVRGIIRPDLYPGNRSWRDRRDPASVPGRSQLSRVRRPVRFRRARGEGV